MGHEESKTPARPSEKPIHARKTGIAKKTSVAQKNALTRSAREKEPAAGKYFAYALLVLVIVFFAAIRFRLRTMPLERDEGEYAYAGQLMLQGIPPYKLAYTMKLPGTEAAYAAIMAVFGQTPAGIHLGLLLVNAATTLLVYFLARRFTGRLAGVVAGASYAALSTSFSVLGLAAHATHFVVLFAVAGLLLLLKALDTGRLWQFFASGVLLGMAFVMKQPGLAFAAFGGLYLVFREWKRPIEWKHLLSKAGCYAAGVALPFAVTCAILFAAGVFKNFWFWVFTYAGQYGSEHGFSLGVQLFMQTFPAVMGPCIGIWVLGIAGLSALWWDAESRRHASFLGGLFLFSFLAVCPGFYFREHYFIMMLPAVAVLAGVAVHSTTQWLARRGGSRLLSAIPALAFLAVFGYAVTQKSKFLFELDPQQVFRKLYGENPFLEAVEVAHYLDAHTSTSDQVAVLGSEPEIYFYSRRHSATGFIYIYGLLEPQKYALEMQKQMFEEIESARPLYMVIVKDKLSWLPRPGSPELQSFSSWANNYIGSRYELVGIAERMGDHTDYHWDDDARTYRPRSQNIVGIFKRKG
ncbi:MAG: glycosyltransferase family 39 protein [Terriglobales bacterium]